MPFDSTEPVEIMVEGPGGEWVVRWCPWLFSFNRPGLLVSQIFIHQQKTRIAMEVNFRIKTHGHSIPKSKAAWEPFSSQIEPIWDALFQDAAVLGAVAFREKYEAVPEMELRWPDTAVVERKV